MEKQKKHERRSKLDRKCVDSKNNAGTESDTHKLKKGIGPKTKQEKEAISACKQEKKREARKTVKR
jgi:hypothetical protein